MRDTLAIAALFSITALFMWAVFERLEDEQILLCNDQGHDILPPPKPRYQYCATIKPTRWKDIDHGKSDIQSV